MADKIVNMYACMATTKTSIRLINTEKNNETGANNMLLKIKISDIKLNIMI